jgi:hypothetical protein
MNIKASGAPNIKRTTLSFLQIFCGININFNTLCFYQHNPENFQEVQLISGT